MALVNLAIVNLFIWPELLEPRAKWVGGAALAVLWLAALWETRGELRRQAKRRQAELEDRVDPETEREQQQQADADRRLMAAQQRYLCGDWLAAERLLLELLKSNKHDIEGNLLLANVWRHLGRPKHAARRLKRIARLEAADRWRFEIEQELEKLAALETLAGVEQDAGASDSKAA